MEFKYLRKLKELLIIKFWEIGKHSQKPVI